MSTTAKTKVDLATLRQFLKSTSEQNASLSAKYSDPIRKLAESLNSQLTVVLAALPTGEAETSWCTEDVLSGLFNCLNSANAITSQLGLELSKMGVTVASPEAVTAEVNKLVAAGELIQKAGITALVDAAIKAKQEAGELVPKTLADQMCSQAKITGIEEGKLSVKKELEDAKAAEQLASKRKEGITTAGLPLPPEEVEALLRGSDADFDAAQKRFTDREEALKKDGVTFASAADLRGNLWLGEAEFKSFAKTVKSIPALRSSADPLAAPATPPADGAFPKRMLV